MITLAQPRTGEEEKALAIALCEAMAQRPANSGLSAEEEAGARAAFATLADALRADAHVALGEAVAREGT